MLTQNFEHYLLTFLILLPLKISIFLRYLFNCGNFSSKTSIFKSFKFVLYSLFKFKKSFEFSISLELATTLKPFFKYILTSSKPIAPLAPTIQTFYFIKTLINFK